MVEGCIEVVTRVLEYALGVEEGIMSSSESSDSEEEEEPEPESQQSPYPS